MDLSDRLLPSLEDSYRSARGVDLDECTVRDRRHRAGSTEHGNELADLADLNGAALGYEAAVAGGIPIIKALKEGLAGNDVQRVYGILNGTCNFILTEMRSTGRDFADVLAEAGEEQCDILARMEMQEMIDWRAQVPCFNDRKPECY